jgi:REP element-mobilizing transposase RayT
MKNTTAPLQPGVYYHIYNRGNNRENLFLEHRNYPYFLDLYKKHIEPVADTYAYCLMRNHFHWLVRIKETSQVLKTCEVSNKKFNPAQGFSNFFNAYAKAINKRYGRTGSLFEERFGRIPVTNTTYFENLIFYIHFNSEKHCFVADFRDWTWSSYHMLIGNGPTILKRDEVLHLFGGLQEFEKFHRERLDEKRLRQLIDKEFDIETDFTGLEDL